MRLENFNAAAMNYVQYQNDIQHSIDCERYPLKEMPRRIFLDTSIINLLAKCHAHVFERVPIPISMNLTRALDLEALMHVFYTGYRAPWELICSAKTLEELGKTKPQDLRDELVEFGIDFVLKVRANDTRQFNLEFGQSYRSSPLPDENDRELIQNAIALQCDVFCTSDRRTIVRKRDKLRNLPLRILTPEEWWAHVKPWAALWG